MPTALTGLNLIVQLGSMFLARPSFYGSPTKFTIGYPSIGLAAARKAAQDALGQIARRIDPAREKQTAKAAARETNAAALDLVENVVAEFVERHAKAKTRDWKETERLLRSNVVPAAWRGRRLSTIGKADVHRLLDGIVDRGAPVGANCVFAQLRKMCSWAVSRAHHRQLRAKASRCSSPESSRDRVLSADELRLVWQASENLGFPFGPLVRLLILTGQRLATKSGFEWVELDVEKKVWTLPGEGKEPAPARNTVVHSRD